MIRDLFGGDNVRSVALGLVLMLVVAVAQVTALDLDKGLVAYYSFDNIEGKILKDDSGNGHDGIIYGNPRVVDGIKGKALEFDGNSYVYLGDTLTGKVQNQLTVSVFINPKMNSMYRYGHIIFYDGSNGEFQLAIHGNTIYFGVKLEKSDWKRILATIPELNKWYHVVGVYSIYEGKIKLYIDGELVNESKIPQERLFDPTIGGRYDPTIGAYCTAEGEFHRKYIGTIDELRIYNRALSEEEIKALYEQTIHPTPKPKLKLSISCDTLLKQGEIRTAELSIENVGDANAKDVTVTIFSPSLGLNIQKGYNLIPPKEARTVSFKVSPNEAGRFTIKAKVEYWDDRGNKYIEETENVITVESTEVVTPTTKKTPGFSMLLAVVILSSLTLLRLKRL